MLVFEQFGAQVVQFHQEDTILRFGFKINLICHHCVMDSTLYSLIYLILIC